MIVGVQDGASGSTSIVSSIGTMFRQGFTQVLAHLPTSILLTHMDPGRHRSLELIRV